MLSKNSKYMYLDPMHAVQQYAVVGLQYPMYLDLYRF